MSKVEEQVRVKNQRRLLYIASTGTYYAPISHNELDSLLGRLLSLIDIVGNQEQAKALKDEIKYQSRAWLDDQYSMAGFDRFTGITDEANPVTVE